MSGKKTVRAYEYVNQPYERVRDALMEDAAGVFRAATRTAADRARSVASELRVNVAGLDVATEIALSVGEIQRKEGGESFQPSTRIPMAWEAERRPRLFPLMRAELSVYPLTPTETQLDFSGAYDPPLGAVGDAIDAVVGHRIAEASVHRFVAQVAHHLRDQLGGRAAK